MAIARESLHGDWVHSHEEDTDREMVFRPADREFPLARGRRRFALSPDGSFTEEAPGPADQPEAHAGSWELDEEDRLVLARAAGGEPPETLVVASAEADRLVVRK